MACCCLDMLFVLLVWPEELILFAWGAALLLLNPRPGLLLLLILAEEFDDGRPWVLVFDLCCCWDEFEDGARSWLLLLLADELTLLLTTTGLGLAARCARWSSSCFCCSAISCFSKTSLSLTALRNACFKRALCSVFICFFSNCFRHFSQRLRPFLSRRHTGVKSVLHWAQKSGYS